jgi:transcriptional antiterminator RfaH
LIAQCDLSGKLLPIERLKKGDQVKISKGPFTNFIAIILSCETDHRIWILMDLMGRKTKVETLPKDPDYQIKISFKLIYIYSP